MIRYPGKGLPWRKQFMSLWAWSLAESYCAVPAGSVGAGVSPSALRFSRGAGGHEGQSGRWRPALACQPACSCTTALVTPHSPAAHRYFLFLISSFLSSSGTNEKTEWNCWSCKCCNFSYRSNSPSSLYCDEDWPQAWCSYYKKVPNQ